MTPVVLVMFGKGSNGKSKLVSLLSSLIGPGQVYSGRIEELEQSRFGIGSLFGKLVFVDDDMRAGVKLPDGVLKKISEEKIISGERKFKDAFEFVIRTLPILIGNNLPSLADVSGGMMRRLHVMRFDSQFLGKRLDVHLFERIATNEMSGVLNRALEGWERLCRLKRFTRSKDMTEAKRELVRHANPLVGFLDDACEKKGECTTSMKDFYRAYSDWAQENGFTMKQTAPVVRRNLENLGYRVPRRRIGRVIVGIRLRN